MQDRGLAAYIAELIGTFFLVLFVTSVFVLFVSPGNSAEFGSDFAVVGLVSAFLLFGLVTMFGLASGGHFNPAVTVAAAAMRRIAPIDAVIYILAQLSGGVLGALLTKGLMNDEGRAINYGAATTSDILGGPMQGMIVEGLGTFLVVLVVCVAALSLRNAKDWGPLAIGTTYGFAVMVFAPLTFGSFNPARWFGPALVSGEWGDVYPFVVGPLVGALLAVAVFRFIIEPEGAGGKGATTPASPASAKATPTSLKTTGDN